MSIGDGIDMLDSETKPYVDQVPNPKFNTVSLKNAKGIFLYFQGLHTVLNQIGNITDAQRYSKDNDLILLCFEYPRHTVENHHGIKWGLTLEEIVNNHVVNLLHFWKNCGEEIRELPLYLSIASFGAQVALGTMTDKRLDCMYGANSKLGIVCIDPMFNFVQPILDNHPWYNGFSGLCLKVLTFTLGLPYPVDKESGKSWHWFPASLVKSCRRNENIIFTAKGGTSEHSAVRVDNFLKRDVTIKVISVGHDRGLMADAGLNGAEMMIDIFKHCADIECFEPKEKKSHILAAELFDKMIAKKDVFK